MTDAVAIPANAIDVGFLRRFLAEHVPLLDARTRACLQAAVILACRCSQCGGSGDGVRAFNGMRHRCHQCDGLGRTWPTKGLTLDALEVEQLAQLMPPMDKELESAIVSVNQALKRSRQAAEELNETRSPAVDVSADRHSQHDDSRRGVQIAEVQP